MDSTRGVSSPTRGVSRRAWTPLLTGPERARVLEAVRAIARDLSERPLEWPYAVRDDRARRELTLLLNTGLPSQALFFGYLERAGVFEGAGHIAKRRLDQSIDLLAETPLAPWLYKGYSGLAWVNHHLEELLGGVATEADRLLERLEQQFSDRPLEAINLAEFEMEGDRLIAEAGPLSFATEQFLGKLVKKAKGLVKGAVNLAKKGIAAVGKSRVVGLFDGVSAPAQTKDLPVWPKGAVTDKDGRFELHGIGRELVALR